MKKIQIAFALTIVVVFAACRKAPAPTQTQNQTAAPAQKMASQPVASQAATPGQPATAGQPAATPMPPAKPVPQTLPSVVARVNGEAISRADFERAVQVVEARAGGPVPPDRRDEILRGILDQLISYRLLQQEARARKVEATPAEIESRVADIKKQFPNQQAFDQALKQRHTTVQQFTADTKNDLAVGKLAESEAAKASPVTDADAKQFYDKNPEQFKQGETVRASHIFVRVPPNADAATKQKARAKLEAVEQKLKAGGDFAQLARENSEDGSAPAGGDLNYFARGQMVPAFEKVAFELKPGQTSGIVETQFGYHIIKVTDHKPPQTVPFEQVKAQITNYLMQQRQQEKAGALVEQLRAKAKIEILI